MLGSTFAQNWLAHNYQVAVWNRSPEAMTELAKAGATPYSSLESLVAAVDCVASMLWDAMAQRRGILREELEWSRSQVRRFDTGERSTDLIARTRERALPTPGRW